MAEYIVTQTGPEVQEALNDALSSYQLPESGIPTEDIADSAITTAKLADGAVTTPKLADSAVTSAKIGANAVTSAKINNGAVSEQKLATALQNKINDAVTLSTDQVISGEKVFTQPVKLNAGAFSDIDLDLEADRDVKIEAEHGDIDLSAAVDVFINGARVFVNSQLQVLGDLDVSGSIKTNGQDVATKAYTDTQLATKQDTIADLDTIRAGAALGATAYQKPSGGIPETDLSASVQTSLGKADTALQDIPDGSVTTPKIADEAVTLPKIASAAIDATPTEGSHNLVESGGVYEKIKQQVNATITKDVVWSNGYINTNGEINSSSLSYYSQPILLHAGEEVRIGTQNSNICIIGSTNADSLSVGDTVSVIQTTPNPTLSFVTYEYIATEDIKVVLCVLASNYTLDFFDTDTLDFRVQKIENHYPVVQNGMDDLTIMDEEQNILALFKGGHIKTRNFDSSELTMQDKEDIDVQLCDNDGHKVLEIKDGNIETKQFNSEEVADAIDNVHSYISAEAYNQIPIEKCGYDKVCRFPTCTVDKGKVVRKYEQFNYITRIAFWGDPHIGYGYSFIPSGNCWKNWEDYVELSFKRASNKVPDFGIPLGDNLSSVDYFLYMNGGRGIIERSDWYNRIRQFNYPLFSIFGNHDDAIPDFIHNGVIEIQNIRIIVFHMDIVYASPVSTYNISDYEFAWLENAVKDSYNKGFVTVLASHYAIICDSGESNLPIEYLGTLLVGTHGQDLIDLCQTYDVRLHIHGHAHPTGLPYRIMTNNGVPFDMTTVEIGLGARAYVILEIRDDGFHFTEYPVTRATNQTEEGGVLMRHFEVLDDAAGRTLFVPFYNQASGTVRSDDWTPYPGVE